MTWLITIRVSWARRIRVSLRRTIPVSKISQGNNLGQNTLIHGNLDRKCHDHDTLVEYMTTLLEFEVVHYDDIHLSHQDSEYSINLD